MSRILVHMAVPESKREIAASMEGLSGFQQEHSVECGTIPAGPSAQWDAAQSYNGKWWGASQAFAPEIAQEMLTSGYTLNTESWFIAYDEKTRKLINHNLPEPPIDDSFESFLVAAGLSRTELEI